MKLKMLSGDFAASYYEVLEEYKQKQNQLDEEYSQKIKKFANMERNRLEANIPVEFKPGMKVSAYPDKIGTVVGSKIEFEVNRGGKDEWGQEVQGPNAYWPLECEHDEAIITCEGYIRTYLVKFDSHEIEKDWGLDSKVLTMYADEFEPYEANENTD